MLAYNEIKNDIKNGYDYNEYSGKWYNFEYTISFEKRFNEMVFYFTDGEYESYSHLDIDNFLGINSYKEYTTYLNHVLAYNLLPISE